MMASKVLAAVLMLGLGGLGMPAVAAEPLAAGPVAAPAKRVELPRKPQKAAAREAKVSAVYVARHDLDGDGRLSDAELAAAIKQLTDASLPVLFKDCDKNANGKLEDAEAADALAAALRQYDLDADGKLDIREASRMSLAATKEAALELRREKAKQKVPAVYVDRYDLDGDGKLSDAELQMAGQRLAEASLPVLFKDCDKNGNGVLDGGELPAAQAAALQQYDLNGDGKFDFGEAVKMNLQAKILQKQIAGKEADARRERGLLKRYDLDGDGQLKEAELLEAKKLKQENIKAPPLDE